MKIIEYFEVLGHSDTTEGRGPLIGAARFSTRAAAVEFVKSKEYSKWCVMGFQSVQDERYIKNVKLVILDSVKEFKFLQNENLKEIALSKLTREEKEVLGLA